jgi:hypothetical protein
MPADEARAVATPATSEQRSFKVVVHGGADGSLSATLSLDAIWLARPFAQSVVKPVVLKLNRKRVGHAPVSAEQVEAVLLDGVAASNGVPASQLLAAAARDVVPSGTQSVELRFGEGPPTQLKFAVRSGAIGFTITLDERFLRKRFVDAVIKPFVTMYNRREVHNPIALEELVEVRVNGEKAAGELRASVHQDALTFLGRHPSHVELFFSMESLQAAQRKPHNSLRFKVYVPSAAELHKNGELVLDHNDINSTEAEDLAAQMVSAAPMKELKYVYLGHNDLRDAGVAAISKALTRKICPVLRKVSLSHNRITNEGVKALLHGLAHATSQTPELKLLALDENWIGDEGAAALSAAVDEGTLKLDECNLAANHAISASLRARLATARPGVLHACIFRFDEVVDAVTTSQPIDDSARAWSCQRE